MQKVKTWSKYGEIPHKTLARLLSITSMKHFERDVARIENPDIIKMLISQISSQTKQSRLSPKNLKIVQDKVNYLNGR